MVNGHGPYLKIAAQRRFAGGSGCPSGGTECRATGGQRAGRDAAALQPADVLSRRNFRLGRGCGDSTTRVSIILPVVLALVLNLLLQPAVHLLERLHLPRAIGALCCHPARYRSARRPCRGLIGPATIWAKRLPEGIPRLEAHLVVLRSSDRALQKVIQQAEHVADAPGQSGSITAVRRDLGLTGVLFAGTRAVLDGLLTTVLVLYFLIVSGDIFLRRIVEILPTFRNKRQAVDISQQVRAGHFRLSGDDHGDECRGGGRDRSRDVSLRGG